MSGFIDMKPKPNIAWRYAFDLSVFPSNVSKGYTNIMTDV